MLRIDTHQHFWKLSRGDYGWLTEDLTELYRDFLPKDVKPILDQLTGTTSSYKTVVVQAAPTLEETKFLLSLACDHDFIVGVVGWVDFDNSDVLSDLAELNKSPYFTAVRPMIQNIEDDDWMLNGRFDKVFKSLIDLDLSFDALVLPKHLGQLNIIAKRYPKLRIVIDHCAKPAIQEKSCQENQQWSADIKELTQHKNVYCKLSGLMTEAGQNPDVERIEQYMDYIFSIFPANRVMWGSDWPVVNLTSDYQKWYALAEKKINQLSSLEQAQIWVNTAKDFYKLAL
jgi:L-fuconolactonase